MSECALARLQAELAGHEHQLTGSDRLAVRPALERVTCHLRTDALFLIHGWPFRQAILECNFEHLDDPADVAMHLGTRRTAREDARD